MSREQEARGRARKPGSTAPRPLDDNSPYINNEGDPPRRTISIPGPKHGESGPTFTKLMPTSSSSKISGSIIFQPLFRESQVSYGVDVFSMARWYQTNTPALKSRSCLER